MSIQFIQKYISIHEYAASLKLDMPTVKEIECCIERWIIAFLNGKDLNYTKLNEELSHTTRNDEIVAHIIKIIAEEIPAVVYAWHFTGDRYIVKINIPGKYVAECNISGKHIAVGVVLTFRMKQIQKMYGNDILHQLLHDHLQLMVHVTRQSSPLPSSLSEHGDDGALYLVDFAGQQWGVMKSKIAELHVKNEAFASPFNARLFGRGRFFSLFENDRLVGSSGSIFDLTDEQIRAIDGNWVVNPPFIESIMEDAVSIVLRLLDTYAASGEERMVYIYLPYWPDASALLRLDSSKYLKNKTVSKCSYEDHSGKLVQTTKKSAQYIMSSISNG